MMVENKLTITAILSILIGGGFVALMDIDDTANIYKCDSKMVFAQCHEIRDSSGKPGYRCLYEPGNNRKYYSCSSGWYAFEGEIPLIEPEVTVTEAVEAKIPSGKRDIGTVVIMPGGERYFPSPDGKTCYLEGNLRAAVECDSIA